tara:strand:- start:75 stop:191 length:117 start_codon:yes stop_codon:yes gene_type:complete
MVGQLLALVALAVAVLEEQVVLVQQEPLILEAVVAVQE